MKRKLKSIITFVVKPKLKPLPKGVSPLVGETRLALPQPKLKPLPKANTKPLPKAKTKPKPKTKLEAKGLSLENIKKLVVLVVVLYDHICI